MSIFFSLLLKKLQNYCIYSVNLLIQTSKLCAKQWSFIFKINIVITFFIALKGCVFYCREIQQLNLKTRLVKTNLKIAVTHCHSVTLKCKSFMRHPSPITYQSYLSIIPSLQSHNKPIPKYPYAIKPVPKPVPSAPRLIRWVIDPTLENNYNAAICHHIPLPNWSRVP